MRAVSGSESMSIGAVVSAIGGVAEVPFVVFAEEGAFEGGGMVDEEGLLVGFEGWEVDCAEWLVGAGLVVGVDDGALVVGLEGGGLEGWVRGGDLVLVGCFERTGERERERCRSARRGGGSSGLI